MKNYPSIYRHKLCRAKINKRVRSNDFNNSNTSLQLKNTFPLRIK